MRERNLILPIEAAKEIGRNTSTLSMWRFNGYGPPFFKLGKVVLYDRTELKAWVEAQRRVPPQSKKRMPPASKRSAKSAASRKANATA